MLLQNKEDPVIKICQEGPCHKEYHLFQGMKRHSMVIVILAISLDIRLLIADLGTDQFSLELEVHVLMLNVHCYNCHHYDHIERDCRNNLNNIFECYNCHMYGHIARDCRQRINKVWRRKEQVQATENNMSREEKGNKICQLILVENDAKR